MRRLTARPGRKDRRKPSAAHWVSADLPAEQDTGADIFPVVAGSEDERALLERLHDFLASTTPETASPLVSLEDEGRLGRLRELVDYIEGREPCFPFDLTGRQFSSGRAATLLSLRADEPKGPDGQRQRCSTAVFLLLHVDNADRACLRFVWYFAPLGLGFAEGPANPLTRRFAAIIFAVSWLGGIPALLIGQVLSAILMALGRTRYAYIVPLLSIGSFLLCAAIVLHFYK